MESNPTSPTDILGWVHETPNSNLGSNDFPSNLKINGGNRTPVSARNLAPHRVIFLARKTTVSVVQVVRACGMPSSVRCAHTVPRLLEHLAPDAHSDLTTGRAALRSVCEHLLLIFHQVAL